LSIFEQQLKLPLVEAGAELLERKMVCGGVNSLGAVRNSLSHWL
jgi:hypothetical protein